MSIWTDLSRFLSSFVADAFSTVVEKLRTLFVGDADHRRRVAFSVAIIALSAKMAKADGIVTRAEVEAFREIFEVPPQEFENVSRLYNLAKQDIAGYDAYAEQVRSFFPGKDDSDDDILRDVMDALFHIAKADGSLHENELLFLEDIALRFGFGAEDFDRIKLRHVMQGEADPYFVLGAEPDWDFARIKSHYRRRVMESHPDRLIARGLPHEFVTIANDRVAALNQAWETIKTLHEAENRVAVLAS
ncbi:MAG: DnaJ family molecular chaperone [Pseudomonadota bacterium]